MNPDSSSTTISLEPLSGASKRENSFTLALPSPSSIPWLTPRVRTWESFLLYLRAVNIFCTLALIGTSIADGYITASTRYGDSLIAIILTIPALANVLWDVADALVRLARHGRGITPKAEIGCELVLLLADIACGVLYAVTSVPWTDMTWYYEDVLPEFQRNAVWAIVSLWLFMLIARAIFFVRACMDRSRELKFGRPRRMYIPATGAVVYLVSKPRKKSPVVEALSEAVPAPRGSDDSTNIPTRQVTEEIAPPPQPATRSALMSPPPEDYVPDEAELERRRRGDAQPQLILPGDIAPKFSSNILDEAAPGASFAMEGKVLIWPKREDPLAEGLSTGPRRRSL